MGAERIKSSDAVYAIDWDGVHLLLRSWACAKLTAQYAEVKNVEHPRFGPDIWSVEVDWEKVGRDTTRISDEEFRRYTALARTSMTSLLADLAAKLDEAAKARSELADRMREAQSMTMRNVESSIRAAKIGIRVATEIRNLSAEFLMFGASIVTAGAATIAVVGTSGAALKSFGSYQDAGYTHRGHAAAVFGAEMVTTFVPVGGAKLLAGVKDEGLKFFYKICFVKLEAGLDGAKAAWVEGKNTQAATKDAANTLLMGHFGEIAEASLPERARRWVTPVEFTIHYAISRALDLMEQKSEQADEPKSTPSPPPPAAAKPHLLMDFAIFDSRHIKHIAIRKLP